ncbi:MAG: maleylpyruvate isomerase family mycothiol-dependent enzyme [Nocardioides sp.]|uniref:maleylpyruvate isomerase family mycothiol-dependent enzyme n=1 Tax=Nocardioides sp. TaxID=35761 RepID=UPI003EFF4820
MDSDTIWSHIDASRADLAGLLDTLTPEQWATDSLCPGWTVRDVGAHLTMAQARLREVLGPMVRARFDYNTMILTSARELPVDTSAIPDALRAMLGSRRRAPFVSEVEPLIDVLVHTQDIRVPLGLPTTMDPAAAVVAAERIVVLNRLRPFRLRPPVTDVRLVADDVDWSTGQGPTVSGPVGALVMLLAGRDSAARPHLSGALERVPAR